MIISADYKCKDCNHVWEHTKENITDDFPQLDCPECGSSHTFRRFAMSKFEIAEGKVGNSKNGFQTNVVYHPCSIGKYKGTKRIR